MRILGVGDLHGDIHLAEKLSKKALEEKVDLVIFCGDLIEHDSLENVLEPFKNKKLKMLIVSGNHDGLAAADFLAKINDAKHIHGYSVKYQDIGIFGCGSANIGIHALKEQEIFETLKKGHEKISYLDKKIMVTHIHPTNTKMEKLSKFVKGSTGVLYAVKELEPNILFCSHVHEAEGIEEKIGNTRIINVGKSGKIIDL